MRTDEFWGLIEQARTAVGTDAAGGADADRVAERVTASLARRDPTEIIGYHRHQWRVMSASYRVDLWAAAYWINGGASDDGFEYFRGWLMAQGRAVFARAVADPDSLANLPAVRRAADTGEEYECEDLLGAAVEAYRTVTGTDLPPDPDNAPYPELGEFWDFDDPDEAYRRLPRLAALFVEPPDE